MNLINLTDADDKAQRALLNRELLKCEKALIQEGRGLHSWQDKFILGWSSLISDYGISWIRPLALLFGIGILWATLAYFALSRDFSWWLLFSKFFNPLTNLSTMEGVTDNVWISSLVVLQKFILAILYYEIIKILRRFSR